MMVRALRVVRMTRLMSRMMFRRGVHSRHAAHAVEAQGFGGASHPWPERQGDLPGTSAWTCRVNVSQAGRFGTHDAVIAMSDVTPLTHVTPMGNVTTASHVVCMSGRARKAPSGAIPYEVAAAEMAAARAATREVPASSAATSPATATAAVAPAATATTTWDSTRGTAGRAGSCSGRSDESGNAEEGGERDEASTHGSVS